MRLARIVMLLHAMRFKPRDNGAMSDVLTRNQQLVFDALLRDAHPRSAYALLDDLRSDGFRAPLQVYRALAKLTDLGLVHKLESINAYVACAHPHQHAHGLVAFAICDRCKQTSEFSDDAVSAHLAAWAGAQGFQQTQTIIEMRGVCQRCARAPDI